MKDYYQIRCLGTLIIFEPQFYLQLKERSVEDIVGKVPAQQAQSTDFDPQYHKLGQGGAYL